MFFWLLFVLLIFLLHLLLHLHLHLHLHLLLLLLSLLPPLPASWKQANWRYLHNVQVNIEGTWWTMNGRCWDHLRTKGTDLKVKRTNRHAETKNPKLVCTCSGCLLNASPDTPVQKLRRDPLVLLPLPCQASASKYGSMTIHQCAEMCRHDSTCSYIQYDCNTEPWIC